MMDMSMIMIPHNANDNDDTNADNDVAVGGAGPPGQVYYIT